MKTIHFLSVAAATLFVATLSGAPNAGPSGYVHPVGAVQHATGPTITVGTPAMEVLLTLGSPTRWLNGDTWVYHGFFGSGQRFDDHCHNLIVTMKDGRVAGLQLGCDGAVAVLAAKLHPKPTPQLLVANHAGAEAQGQAPN